MSKTGTIIALANNKGGVGKTSVTCNLGIALANQGYEVLIVDTDNQCDSTKLVMPQNTKITKCMFDVLESQMDKKELSDLEDCVYPSKYKNLYMIPNIEDSSGLDMDLGALYPDSLPYLRNAIRDYVSKNFAYTLIDTPPTLSIHLGNALFASDFAIIPIDSESGHSIDGLRRILELINSIQNSGNPDLKFLRILINRVDKRTSIGKVIIADLNKRFSKDQIFKNSIPVNTKMRQGEYVRKSIFEIAPSSKTSNAYRNLAKELSIISKKGK